MANRIENYVLYTKGIINIKTTNYCLTAITGFTKINAQAGLYKPSELTLQHKLIFTAILGKPPTVVYQIHGKRRRRTVSFNTILNQSYNIYAFLGKLIYEIIPILSDFRTPKWHKNSKGYSYTFRIRQKFTYFDEINDLISNQMYDSHKGIFLPLNFNLQLKDSFSHSNNEIYMRLVHFPISLFKRRPRPAYDDSIKFE